MYQITSAGQRGSEIKMGFPSLDYGNYLHVFSTTAPSGMPTGASYGLTYTATEDCYLYGDCSGVQTYTDVTINGTKLTGKLNVGVPNSQGGIHVHDYYDKLKAGDVVTVSANSAKLYIMKER